MRFRDQISKERIQPADFPRFEGRIKIKLHNPTTGKTEIHEGHNAATNAIADIFIGNHGGLVDYDSFRDIYRTWLGGILAFASPLDPTAPNDYGIPAYTTNQITAHAGQATITDQADDRTRGNPDSTGTVITNNSAKLTWEWGTSAGNGTISSLALTHTDVGSYGVAGDNGRQTEAQKLLDPFAVIGCKEKSYAYGDDANAVMAVNGNLAYNFYLVDNTTVDIFKAPINNSKFKLQGGALEPLTDYATKITATLPNSYAIAAKGGCYYHFDFTNNKLVLFGVPTEGGTTLYQDTIDLDTGTVVHGSIEVTGAKLWKFTGRDNPTGYSNYPLPIPTKAMIKDNHLYVYGNTGTGQYDKHPEKIFKINLANTADITEINTDDTGMFDGQSYAETAERFASIGGLIVHDSFIINGGKALQTNRKTPGLTTNHNYTNTGSISSPVFGIGGNFNSVSACKLYLGTKYNLDTPITKSPAQSMTIEYTLQEV